MKLPADLEANTAVLLSALKAAIHAGKAQTTFVAQAQSIQHWPALLARAQAHGLMPLLYRVLLNGEHDFVPAEAWAELHVGWQANTVHSLKLTAELTALLHEFDTLGVQALAFKGLPLAMLAYGALDWRQAGDLDLLVKPADVVRTQGLLAGRGYNGSPDLTETANATYLALSFELTCWHPLTRHQVDVHWALTPKVLPFGASFTELAQRRVITTPGGKPVPTLSVEDLVLYLSVHSVMHQWERMIWLGDLGGLIARHPTLDWPELLRHAQRQDSERLLLSTLALAQTALDVTLPADIQQKIEADRSLPALVAEALRQMSQPSFAPPGAWARNLYYLRLHKGWSARARYLGRVLTTPNVNDWLFLRLPPRWGFLYPLVRPLRWLKACRPSFSRNASTTKHSS